MNLPSLEGIQAQLDSYLDEFRDVFPSEPSRVHMATYVNGQLGPLRRKNVEAIAREAGTPVRTLQQFLGLYRWDESAMRTQVRRVVARDHAHESALGVIDETSFAKKGDKTVGVQRQWCGSTGKVDNCVQTVHLSYVTEDFATPIDCDLYLPESWADDRDRREEAGVPDDVSFRTKWEIALDLLDRSREDGLQLVWITADEAYGRSSAFREGLTARGLLYVLEIPVDTMGWTPRGLAQRREHRRVDELFKRGGPSWVDFHVKDSTKGPVVWQVRATRFVSHAARDSTELWLLTAFNPLTGEMKYFLSNTSEDMPIGALLTIAFSRWRVERNFQDSKQEVGLDDFEVRTYTALQRHLALSMVSHLFLVRIARTLGEEMSTKWSLRQTCALANAVVDQTLVPEQRKKNVDHLLDNNRYYDRRARVAERCHTKKRCQVLRDAGIDLQRLTRCPAWPAAVA